MTNEEALKFAKEQTYIFGGTMKEFLQFVIDKLERPQGEWIVKSNGTTNYYTCDKCGNAGDIQDKFCRECGAKMKGD